MWNILQTLAAATDSQDPPNTSTQISPNYELPSIDGLRLYSIHIDFSLQLKSQWIEKVQSDAIVAECLNSSPLLAWVKQQQRYMKLFHESVPYRELQVVDTVVTVQ